VEEKLYVRSSAGQGMRTFRKPEGDHIKKMDHSRIEWPIGEAAPKGKLLRHCVRIASLRFALRSRFIVLLLLRRTVLLRSAALLLLWRRPGRTVLLSRWRRRLWGARMLRNRPIDCVSASVVICSSRVTRPI